MKTEECTIDSMEILVYIFLGISRLQKLIIDLPMARGLQEKGRGFIDMKRIRMTERKIEDTYVFKFFRNFIKEII